MSTKSRKPLPKNLGQAALDSYRAMKSGQASARVHHPAPGGPVDLHALARELAAAKKAKNRDLVGRLEAKLLNHSLRDDGESYRLPPESAPRRVSRDEAETIAAWLAAVRDPRGGARAGAGRKKVAGPSQAGVAVSLRLTPEARAALRNVEHPGAFVSELVIAAARKRSPGARAAAR